MLKKLDMQICVNGRGRFQAHAVLNGRLTSSSCMHQHHTRDAAQACGVLFMRGWADIALRDPAWLSIGSDGLMAVLWADDLGRQVQRRFIWLQDETTN